MTIHAIVPGNKPAAVHVLADRLVGILPDMLGRDNARTSGWIMRRLGESPSGTNQRLRAAAKHLLVERGLPVISCPAGFFYADTREELEAYKASLRSRIDGLFRDVSAVDRVLESEPFTSKRQRTLAGL